MIILSCPQFEGEKYLLRLVTEDDGLDLWILVNTGKKEKNTDIYFDKREKKDI